MSELPRPTSTDDPAAALVAVVRRLHARGLAPGTGGNMSVVVPGPPRRLLITASGVDKGHATADELVLVDADGAQVGGRGRPSAETALHVALAGRGAGAILHVHSVWNTLASLRGADAGALTITGLEMLKGLAGVTSHHHREVVPVIDNSQDLPALAAALGRAVDEHRHSHGVLVAGHGLYTWGPDLAVAERHVEVFEFLFEVIERFSARGEPWPV
ncbi:MAG: methylthioribulose 1-phosphate dehydratase [Myxococcales bacterium]|nr:methylthioribulose 1-phosphate dehydratase [Myxococcales bacterium]